MVRQPEFIVRSIILDRQRKGKRMSARSILHECFDAQNVIQEGYEVAVSGEAAVVVYEELTENPMTGIEKLCGEIGIPYEPVNAGPDDIGSAGGGNHIVPQDHRGVSAGMRLAEGSHDAANRAYKSVPCFSAADLQA